jgi:ribA/ribD-fused uncharacterized protein
MSYNIEWLTEKFNKREQLKFLFFWGHRKSKDGTVTNSCFSQWYESPFEINGVIYKTTEHWMMAQKALLFDNFDIYEQIIQAESPGKAKAFGRAVTDFDEAIWKEHRSEIVRIGNIHKFNQDQAFGTYLLNTHHRILVEASPVDTIWGIGLTKDSQDAKNVAAWRGLNLLGFALMEARDFLQEYGFFEVDFKFKTPWNEVPEIKSDDEFWKIEKGKAILLSFTKNWKNLNEREQAIFKVSFPEPKNWKGFYDL